LVCDLALRSRRLVVRAPGGRDGGETGEHSAGCYQDGAGDGPGRPGPAAGRVHVQGQRQRAARGGERAGRFHQFRDRRAGVHREVRVVGVFADQQETTMWKLFRRGVGRADRSNRRVEPLEGRVLFAAVGGVDTTPPVAAIEAENLTTFGATFHTVRVVYTDDVAVDAISIDRGDIHVEGPKGELPVTDVIVDFQVQVLTATYTLEGPREGFNALSNTTYTVTVAPGAVTDTSGNPVAGTSGQFAIAIPVPHGPDLVVNILNSPALPAAVAPGGSVTSSFKLINQGDAPVVGKTAL